MHRLFNKSRKPGLTDLLSSNLKLDQVMIKLSENLDFIPAGKLSYNPQSILESESLTDFIKNMAGKYDYVLYDSIPSTSFTDVDILATKTDAVIIIVDEKNSEKETARVMKKRLDSIKANVIGAAITKTRPAFKRYYRERICYTSR